MLTSERLRMQVGVPAPAPLTVAKHTARVRGSRDLLRRRSGPALLELGVLGLEPMSLMRLQHSDQAVLELICLRTSCLLLCI